MPPFCKLITSVPFIALTLLHYGNLWGLYFLITAAPKFMSEVGSIYSSYIPNIQPKNRCFHLLPTGNKIIRLGTIKKTKWLYYNRIQWKVLGFNLAQAGILASLPYLARLSAGFLFGSIGDALIKSNVMSTTSIRKMFCIFC